MKGSERTYPTDRFFALHAVSFRVQSGMNLMQQCMKVMPLSVCWYFEIYNPRDGEIAA